MFKNINALLFDLDGTLIDSEKAFFVSFKKILKKNYNIEITNEDYKTYELDQNGKLLQQLKKNNLKDVDISEEEIMNLIYTDYEEEFKKIILEKEAVNNFNVLRKLKKCNFVLGLVTTCKRYYIDILLKQLDLGNLFDVIVAREDVENLKPAPDAYLKAMKMLNLNKNTTLVFEDSKRGIDAAISSGLKTIQVSNFSSIKYLDDRAMHFESVYKAIIEILEVKELEI